MYTYINVMDAVKKEVDDLVKSFEDAVFNNEDILTCVISGVKYAEVVGAIEFIACTTFEKAQSTWSRIKDKYVQECKTYWFGFEPGLKNAVVANLETLIMITFTLKGSWATAFQGASAKVLSTKEDPMMELLEALRTFEREEASAREPSTTSLVAPAKRGNIIPATSIAKADYFDEVPDVPEGHDWSYVTKALAEHMREVKADYSESTLSGDTICDLEFVLKVRETLPLYGALLELDPGNKLLVALQEWITSGIERKDYGYRPMHAVFASDATLLEMYGRMRDTWMETQLGFCRGEFSTLEQLHTYLDADNFERRVSRLLRFIKYPMGGRSLAEIMEHIKHAMRDSMV